MTKESNLAEKLLTQDGADIPGLEEQLAEIRHMIRKEHAKLIQMKIITGLLWIASFAVYYFHRSLTIDAQVTQMSLYLGVATRFIPLAATLSSILLLVRLSGISRKEANLRLKAIEIRLDQLTRKQ